jgi:hypothetical protein
MHMKKSFFSISLAVLISWVFQSSVAFGIAGLAGGGAGLAIGGLAIAYGGVRYERQAEHQPYRDPYAANIGGAIDSFVGRILTIAGILILDGEQGRVSQFARLTPQDANDLGIDEHQMQVFNSELSLIKIAAEGASMDLQTQPLVHSNRAAIETILNHYFANVSPVAYDVTKAIAIHSFSPSQE